MFFICINMCVFEWELVGVVFKILKGLCKGRKSFVGIEVEGSGSFGYERI